MAQQHSLRQQPNNNTREQMIGQQPAALSNSWKTSLRTRSDY